MDKKQSFENLYPSLVELVEKRKSGLKLISILEWEDVKMILLARLWEKFHLYDQTRPLENWVNMVISNALMNLSRNNLYRFARPCIAADSYGNPCAFNLGGANCAKTPSKKQCSECKLYAAWQHKKELKFNVATPLALENHIHESHNMPAETINIDRAKQIIDEKILEQLTPHESELYRLLYIEHLPMEQVGTKMKYKVQKNSKVAGYQVLLKFSRKIKILAREIINEHELA
jgi:RNA polymerase sigma factor (sigma-70 family)